LKAQVPWLRVFVQGVVIVGEVENYRPGSRAALAVTRLIAQQISAASYENL